VQKSLAKLGPQPAQNELLAELIRLASLAGPSSGSGSTIVSESSDVSSEYSVNCHRPLSLTSSDDAPLRHIVIDGSNVAVR
jgi:ribonuclease ZC3H12